MSAIPPVPPPTYSQQNDGPSAIESSSTSVPTETQILISPAPNAVNFQKGYLGAEGERAAIEGELHIKAANSDAWESVTLSLCSFESVDNHKVELNSVQLILFSRGRPSPSGQDVAPLPSAIPFSIPLTPDTPQCVHTMRSSLSHELTVTLHAVDRSLPAISRTVEVHTRRYSSHLTSLEIAPFSATLNDPTLVEVEVPRTTYRTDEPIPVYISIPPPERTVVLDQGFALRNVKAELVRSTTFSDDFKDIEITGVGERTPESGLNEVPATSSSPEEPHTSSYQAPPEKQATSSRPWAYGNLSQQNLQTENGYETVVSHSGASCRFHSSRQIRVRLLLHTTNTSPSAFLSELPNLHHSEHDSDSQCSTITQTTLLHSVTFCLRVYATFLHASNHTERVSTATIPITMLPPPAPLPEVEPSLDAAYLKKHDRPPTKTVRREDADVAYEFEENQAGPSALSNGAPPPFDDAPPPFFSTIPEASTSSRLPTFLESESEVLVPDDDHPSAPTNLPPHPNRLQVAGEGSLFGFLQVDQYDGHSDEMQRSSTPPPTLEMAQDDADVTGLAGLLTQPAQTLNALDLSLENDGRGDQGDLQPPPPPPMDDPLDPPPSIDSEYRSSASDPPPSIDSDFVAPGGGHMSPPRLGSPSPSRHAEPPPALDNPPTEISRTPVPTTSPSHAPPPYLIPANLEQHQHDSVTHTRPPPYVDFMPSTEP